MSKPSKQHHLLDIALTTLTQEGYQNFTMAKVARIAGSSKETLYNYFGNKEGLVIELIRHKSHKADLFKPYASLHPDSWTDCLEHFGRDLLMLIMSEESIAINRMVISIANENNGLTEVLNEHGRKPVKNHIISQLETFDLEASRRAIAYFEVYLSLQIYSVQLNVLSRLISPLSDSEIDQHSKVAMQQFLKIISPPFTDPKYN